MENLEILKEVQSELKRFTAKLNAAIKENGNSGKSYAACKRSALDLKNELTKLTQDSKYKYGRV